MGTSLRKCNMVFMPVKCEWMYALRHISNDCWFCACTNTHTHTHHKLCASHSDTKKLCERWHFTLFLHTYLSTPSPWFVLRRVQLSSSLNLNSLWKRLCYIRATTRPLSTQTGQYTHSQYVLFFHIGNAYSFPSYPSWMISANLSNIFNNLTNSSHELR